MSSSIPVAFMRSAMTVTMTMPGSIKADATIACQSTASEVRRAGSAARGPPRRAPAQPTRLAQTLRRDGEDGDHEIVGDQGGEQRERRTTSGRCDRAWQNGDQPGEGHAEGALERHVRIERRWSEPRPIASPAMTLRPP